ncbi:Potassium channel AKT2/3 [Vitis vinifera]|uniref:Potassium channel AKT2/3 n=1 Tax=Vitis vinifera TaxID=29760 RepID=A0A438CLU4_VITVI|nr:Potassium channel AKT2/3 [Vitis vinifera]
MEMKVPHQLYSLYSASNMIKREDHSRKSLKKPEEKQHDDSKPFNSRNLSKVILPPLGVSSYNQNPLAPKGWIISPMDSRYRYEINLYVAHMQVLGDIYGGFSSLLSMDLPFSSCISEASPNRQLYITDNVVDLFFAVDIVLTFFVAYIDRRTQLLVCDWRKIAVRLVD